MPHLGLTFKPIFRLLEYIGSFSYERNGTNISGQVALKQAGAEESVLNGPMTLGIAGTNALNIAEGQLFRAADASVQTSASYVDLTTTTHSGNIVVDLDGTVYSGIIFLNDGEPATTASDYQVWALVFRDTHDANTNGIPDLTDPPQNGGSSAPALSLTQASAQLKLSIAGTVGATYDLEQSMTLSAVSWERTRSITLTNSTQVIDLSLGTKATMFYRLKVGQ